MGRMVRKIFSGLYSLIVVSDQHYNRQVGINYGSVFLDTLIKPICCSGTQLVPDTTFVNHVVYASIQLHRFELALFWL